MKQAISGAWLYSIVLIFMVILVGFISISINYNKTFKLKTAVVNIVEQEQGINAVTIDAINKQLKNNGYLNGKVCRTLFKDGDKYLEINNGTASGVKTKGPSDVGSAPAQVCITRKKGNYTADGTAQPDYYYDVYLFYSFSIPVFGDIFKFNVMGTTNSIHYPVDSYSW